MTDLRTSVAILEDAVTGGGLPLHKALEGDVAAAKNAHGALVAVDPSLNFAYLRVNAQSELITSSEADFAQVNAKGSASGSASFVDVATLTLSANKVYKNIGFVVGCYRDAEFKIILDDNGTPSDIALGLLMGSGSQAAQLKGLKATAGATGTQQIKIQAKNQNVLSDFRATLTAEEVQ